MVNKYIKMLFKILGSLLILGVVSFLTLQSSNAPNLTSTVRRKRETGKNDINEKIWNKIKKNLSEFTKIKISKLHYSYLWNITNGNDVKKELSIDLDIFKNVSSETSYEKLSEAIKKEINKIKLFIAGDQEIVSGWWWTKNTNNGLKGNKIADSLEDNQPQWIQDVKDKTLDEDIDVILGKLLENSMNDALNNLKRKFQGKLNTLINAGINQFTINNTLYDFNLLLKKTNLKLIGSQLPPNAKNQLLKLVDWSFNEETFDEAVLQEIDRKEKFIEIILKFNEWRKIDKVTIEGTNYPIDQINSNNNHKDMQKIDELQKQIDQITLDNEQKIDELQKQIDQIILNNDPFRTKDGSILEQINKLTRSSIDEQMLIKACLFSVLEFNKWEKINDQNVKKEFSKHLERKYSFNGQKLPNNFVNVIFKKKFTDYEKMIKNWKAFIKDNKNIEVVTINKQKYSLNSSSVSDTTSPFPPLHIALLYIDVSKILTTQNKESPLYPEWKRLAERRENFRQSIKEIIKKLKAINVVSADMGVEGIKQNYSWSKLTEAENIKKSYDELSTEVRKELVHLDEGGQDREKLTKLYKSKIDPFLEEIKSTLQEFAINKITEVTIDGEPYLIGELTKSLSITGSEQVADAKKELVALYNYNSVIQKVKKKLNIFLEETREKFRKNIEDILSKLVAIGVTSTHKEGKKYSWLGITENNDINKKYLNMSEIAKFKFIILFKNNINKEELTLIYENKINPFLKGIKPILQEFAAGNINSVTIDKTTYQVAALTTNLNKKGSELVRTAKTELVNLYNYNSDPNIVQQKLKSYLVTIKNDFKKNIQTSLIDLAAINIKTVKIGAKKYQVRELLKKENINKAYADMSFDAQKEFTNLWIQGINEEKLSKILEDIKLESFHLTIKDILDDFVVVGLTELKVKDKIYTLTELTSSKNQNKDVYQMSSQAREELKFLFNSDFKEEAEEINAVLKSIKLDIEKSLNAILKEKSRLINAGIMLLSFTNGKKVNIIIDITHYINSSKKEGVSKQKYQLLKLRNKNIKKIVDQNIDQDFLEKWQIWKKKSKILKNLKINRLEFVNESTKEKTNINLNLYQVEKNKEKPSEINELSTLKELSKTRKISVEKFKNLINATIQKQNDKILLKKQLTQKNDQKTLTIGLAVGGGALVLGMFGFGIGWFLKFHAKS